MKALSGKPKKCKVCPNKFVPSQGFQNWCSPGCALVILKAKQSKESKVKAQLERKEQRAAKERVKTKGEHAKDSQTAFNAFIRVRDAHLGCVSCKKPADWHGQWHASHFRSVGSAPHLRFDERNVHKACSVCNNWLSGNLIPFKAELIKRIGLEAVEELEADQEPRRYTIDELKAITAKYRAKTRELKKGMDK